MQVPVQVFVSRTFSCLNTRLSQALLCIQTAAGLQRLKYPAFIFPLAELLVSNTDWKEMRNPMAEGRQGLEELRCMFLKKQFIYLWQCWAFVAVCGFSLVASSGGCSLVVCRLLVAVASLVVEQRP